MEREGHFKENVDSDWTNLLFATFKGDQLHFLLPDEPVSTVQGEGSDIRGASSPRGEP